MNNYRERLIKALIKFYEGGIEAHVMNIEVLLGSHVGLAEHGDIIETLDAELEKLSSLEDKLEVLKNILHDIVEALKAQIAEQTALIYSLYKRIKELQDEVNSKNKQ